MDMDRDDDDGGAHFGMKDLISAIDECAKCVATQDTEEAEVKELEEADLAFAESESVSSAANVRAQTNPLLLDVIVDKVLSYLDMDKKAISSSRLVCQTWNNVASHRLGATAWWPIYKKDPKQSISHLIICSSNKKMFQKFKLHPQFPKHTLQYELEFEKYVDEKYSRPIKCFFRAFGSTIRELNLSVAAAQLLVNTVTCLPNLTSLDISETGWFVSYPMYTGLDQIQLPKLKTLSMNAISLPSLAVGTDEDKQITTMGEIFDNAKQLTSLEIFLSNVRTGMTSRLLYQLNLERLSSLKVMKSAGKLHDGLQPQEVEIIATKCRSLNVLHLYMQKFWWNQVGKDALVKLVSNNRHSLQDLQLSCNPQRAAGDIPGIVPVAMDPLALICPHLKRLALRKWRLGMELAGSLPSLQWIEIDLYEYENTQKPWFFGLPDDLLAVTYLKFRSRDLDFVSTTTTESLTNAFPNLEELSMEVGDDGALSTIFASLPKLKRLHLRKSNITDFGVTGMHKQTMIALENSYPPIADLDSAESVAPHRIEASIADLTQLQHFTYELNTLTADAFKWGFKYLRSLTYLQVPPFRKSSFYLAHVPVRILADNCPALIKLDVNNYQRNYHSSSLTPEFEFGGCGITENDIEYLNAKLPYIELVYRPEVLEGWLHGSSPKRRFQYAYFYQSG